MTRSCPGGRRRATRSTVSRSPPDAGGRRRARSSSTRTRPPGSVPGSVDRCRCIQQPASGGKGGQGAAPGKGPALTPPGGGQGGTEPVPARTLTVVGIAASVSTPDVAAWMSPTDLAALTPGVAPAREMLYRVDPSGTAADLSAAVARITATLPAECCHGLDNLSRCKGERRLDRPAVRPDPARVLDLRASRRRLHHRQRRQRHRPDELSRYRRDEGRRIHARAGDGHPRRPDPGPGDARCHRRRGHRDDRESADRRADRPVIRAAGRLRIFALGRRARPGRQRRRCAARGDRAGGPCRPPQRRRCDRTRVSPVSWSRRWSPSTAGTPPARRRAGATRRRGRSRPPGPGRHDPGRPARRRRCGDVRDRDERVSPPRHGSARSEAGKSGESGSR